MVQIFSQFEEVLKPFKVGAIIRGVYNDTDKDYFRFIQKTKNNYIDAVTMEPVELNKFPRIDYIKTKPSLLKYFRKMYKLGKGKNLFEFNYSIENNIIDGSLYILRFFEITIDELYQDTPEVVSHVAEKWGKVVYRYLKRQLNDSVKAKQLVDSMVAELKKVQSLNLIFSYWPIEMNDGIKKPFWLSDLLVFRYLENLAYFNQFNIKDLLLADFEKINEEPACSKLRDAVKSRILEKIAEAKTVLSEEKTAAQQNNDNDSVFEITVVEELLDKEVATLDNTLIQKKTINSLLSYWPEILFPAPSYVKI